MKELYFIRHGQTDYNKRRIVQGSGVDSDLNNVGLHQAQQFYDYYKDEGFDYVITSALKRSWQTVESFINNFNIPYHKTPLINEISWGVHEGKSGTLDMKEAYDQMIKEWSNGNYDARLEKAESANELIARCTEFINSLIEIPHQKILICTHGRTLRCLMCVMKRQEMVEMENYDHHNTGLFRANFTNGVFQFLLENDISHRV